MQDSSNNAAFADPAQQTTGAVQLGLDNNAFLDYDFEADAETTLDFDFPGSDALIGDLGENDTSVLSELDRHEKRKSFDGTEDAEEGGGKRRESEDKTAKKPGRKPLTSEPTSKRKAQNRAAQRAFRERKEKHLLDLESKVEDLEKASHDTKTENGMLKAQIERLQVELKEYRKRLSWISSGSGRAYPPLPHNTYPSQSIPGLKNEDFTFDFPTFGPNAPSTQAKPTSTAFPQKLPSSVETNSPISASPFSVSHPTTSPKDNTPGSRSTSFASPLSSSANFAGDIGLGDMNSLFSPSIIEPNGTSTRAGSTSSNTNGMNLNDTQFGRQANGNNGNNAVSSDSPSSCSDSQNGNVSSITTTPEPFGNSPHVKTNDQSLGTITEENQCGNGNDGTAPLTSTLEPHSFEWFVNQNSGQFDPVLFGDYREQDFGTFFDDAFPLPDLGSPLHTFNDVASPNTGLESKPSLMDKIDAAQNADDDEVVPADDHTQIMTCNKIWDRLQHMEKFRNGEIDIDNLCDELRGKARCSETGVVIDKKDVDAIVNRAH